MSYPPSSYPPSGDYQGGGGYPPPAGEGKTKVAGLGYNIAALLCYLPVCCISIIVPILLLVTEPKESKFVRFHAVQSLLFMVVNIVIFGILYAIAIATAVGTSVGSTGSAAAGAAGMGISLVIFLVELALGAVDLVVIILAMVKSYQFQMWKIPFIGDMAEKWSA